MSEFQPAHGYLPHAAPMVLIERVIAVSEDSAHCQVMVNESSVLAPFLNQRGALPAWFGIEILAQTIGVWSGWHGRQHQDEKPQPGMLLGGRGYRAAQAEFAAGILLDVEITLLMRDGKVGSFEGTIRHGTALLASGRLNTYQPEQEEFQQLLTQGISG
ncbi:3-hydroxy-fatty acyl-ACP dehydratase [Izhakiella australiensis]|uniref:3-hydroxy-fatty acyl-ACP dehydratase n=1 Tax=Izhakiella australiensis TaxID=1926881 RepID=A0A1S8YPF8_9GAMM|nr:hotdog family protein [Izhakiella australiensis]OON40735.1 3-hydroxy-fatty acyl-ACP dehydratase [Izhakiella australiensis]